MNNNHDIDVINLLLYNKQIRSVIRMLARLTEREDDIIYKRQKYPRFFLKSMNKFIQNVCLNWSNKMNMNCWGIVMDYITCDATYN